MPPEPNDTHSRSAEEAPEPPVATTGAPRKRMSKGGAVGIALGAVAVVAAISVGTFAASGGFLPSATREAGEMPNAPAVMARISSWDDETFIREMQLGGSSTLDGALGRNPVFGGLNDVARCGIKNPDCLAVQSGSDKQISGFYIEFREQGAPDERLGIDRLGSTLYLTPENHSHFTKIDGDSLDDCTLDIAFYELANNEILEFGHDEASKISEDMGMTASNSELVEERTYFKPLSAVLPKVLGDDGDFSVWFGMYYEYLLKVRDARGEVFYFKVCATNALYVTGDLGYYRYYPLGGSQSVAVEARIDRPEPGSMASGMDDFEDYEGAISLDELLYMDTYDSNKRRASSSDFGTARNDGSSALTDPEKSFAGTWHLVSMEQDGEVIDPEELGQLAELGMEVYLELDEDGTGHLALFDESIDGTWEARSATRGTIVLEGQDVDMVVSDGLLSLEQEDALLTFARDVSAAGEPATNEVEYILANSDTRVYSDYELRMMTNYELFIARNEIYARHGCEFQNEDLRATFKSKSWYHGTVELENFADSMMSDVERANVNAILEIEKSRNSQYLS